MNKPYIFAHRGAMGYCIENTINAFQKAVEMRVGIETDIQITKDEKLVCFHDPAFQIDNKWYTIKNLTLSELRSIIFEDNRRIPTLREVFDSFSYCPKNFRYSCDILSRKAGLALIDLVEEYCNFDQVEITDTRIYLLKRMRKYNKDIKLVHTLPTNITRIDDQTLDFEKLIQNNIHVLNVKFDKLSRENFNSIMNNGLKCYAWNVNSKKQMKRVLKLRKNGEFVRAIYTNYPDILKNLREQYFE
ncbi:MAG: glycerophosphodiester phosphodiesterase [Promethearchaeota archaeon]|nr:MAG: glycerophosphodiester phosphodiesterase [Candidatus Lokiarchaeota archaeon]